MTKQKTLTVLAAALAGFGWTAVASADPFDVRRVSADAKFVAHVDLDAARGSPLWATVGKAMTVDTALAEKLHQYETTIGLNVVRDLRDVTVYATSLVDDKQVTFVVHGDVNRQQLTDTLRAQPGFATAAYGAYETFRFTQEDDAVFVAFRDKATVVLARTDAALHAALDVLDGKAPAAAVTGVLAGTAPATTRPAFGVGADRPIVYMAATDLQSVFGPGDDHAEAFPLPQLDQVNGGWLTVTAAGSDLVARANVSAKTPAAAEQLRAASDGLRALLGMMSAPDDADVGSKLVTAAARSLAVTRTDADVSARVSIANDDLRQAVEQSTIKVALNDDPTTQPDGKEIGVQLEITPAPNSTTRPAKDEAGH